MIEIFMNSYKDGHEVYLNDKERDKIVEEIQRLNNIINELEKELDLNLPFKVVGVRRLKKKLQKLKG